MTIERFLIPGLAQYSYIVSAEGQAAIIDPVRDVDSYTVYLKAHGLTLRYILETHIHADFAAGSSALAQETGAELALSAYDHGELYQYSMPHRALRNGDRLDVGPLRIEALHTPGHTPEHLSFLLFDDVRSAAGPVALFSGDFLFVGSLGRPDLLGEEAKLGLAHHLFRSLHTRLNGLADSLQILPGHGAGSFCGAGIGEQAESTLGVERRTNPLFALDESAFVREILRSVPPMPSYYPRMKRLNATGAPSVGSLPATRPLSAPEVEQLRREPGVVVLDLRRPECFGGAHIPGAINIGAGQSLSLWAGWLLNASDRILLVADPGDEEPSRRALHRVGLDQVVGFLEGGMSGWIEAGLDLARLPQLSTTEVQHAASHAFVLDVRTETEWSGGHIPGARHIMLGDLPEHLNHIPRDRQVIAVCGSGYRSSIASSMLKRLGVANVAGMSGGMAAWTRRDLPLAV